MTICRVTECSELHRGFCPRKGAAALCVLCAGSNVTGLLADVSRLTSLIHQYGHLVARFFSKMGVSFQGCLKEAGEQFRSVGEKQWFFAKKSVMEGDDSNSIHHVSHEHFCCMGLWVAPVSFDGGDKGNGDSLNFLFQRCVSVGDIF